MPEHEATLFQASVHAADLQGSAVGQRSLELLARLDVKEL
jgi:hypothetical protein